MGKYIRKAKISADVALMEVSQSTVGVCTRAKTLALKRLQSSSPTPTPTPTPTPSNVSDSSSCYLQLRSRRLQKPSLFGSQAHKPSPRKENCQQEPQTKPNPRPVYPSSGSVGSAPFIRAHQEKGCFPTTIAAEMEHDYDFDLGVEASFGENDLDLKPSDKSDRETTPCSFIRDVDVATPGSSTKQRTVNAVNQRTPSAILENIPSAAEIEEFFAHAHRRQQQAFIDKYNFDIVNDMPLPGRYEWLRVNP